MSDYPMLISNKLHSFRNFVIQINIKIFYEDIANFYNVRPLLCAALMR